MRGAGTGNVGIAAAGGAAGGVTVSGSMAGTGKVLHTAGVKCDIQVGVWGCALQVVLQLALHSPPEAALQCPRRALLSSRHFSSPPQPRLPLRLQPLCAAEPLQLPDA